ncbi:MAG: lysophospholipid acyltransferase family protein [Candidatus Cloacimonadaceae bacterium]|jgi:lysophospholipid acyltransferase (LPLAT)-like uncharacterized protein
MPGLLFKIEARLGAWLIRLLRKTIKWEIIGQPADDFRCIFSLWHKDLLIMTMQRVDSGIAVLVSGSKDGELIAGPLLKLGYHTVRGSSSRQGAQAFRGMVRISREHALAITPDGPKGPAGTIHAGVFEIAMLAKIPIVALAVDTPKAWVLNTWDGLRIPKPFSRVRVHYSQPLYLKSREDIAEVERAIREFTKVPAPAEE